MSDFDREKWEKDYEEFMANCAWLLTEVHNPVVQAHLRAQGIDPRDEEAGIRKLRDERIAMHANVEAAEDKVLQCQADQADSAYELYKMLRKMAKERKEADPFNPAVQEFDETVTEWSEHFPKEPEE